MAGWIYFYVEGLVVILPVIPPNISCVLFRRYTLHIIDTDPLSLSANGWLEDTSKVQKYEMSDSDYSQRENTYRKFKESKLKVRRRPFSRPVCSGRQRQSRRITICFAAPHVIDGRS